MASQCPRRRARVAVVDTPTPSVPTQVAATSTPMNFSADVAQTMYSLNPFRSPQKTAPVSTPVSIPTPAYVAPASQDF